MNNEIYVLLEKDTGYRWSIRVFKSYVGAKNAFDDALRKHFNKYGYGDDHLDIDGNTYGQCVLVGTYSEKDYFLCIERSTLED